jgi:hypothetical protein
MVHLKSSTKSEGTQNTSKERQLLAFIQSNPKPFPQDFESYKEYEMALVRWKEVMEGAIRSAEIVLPTPQGRYHYRPTFNPQQRNRRNNHSPQTSSSDDNPAKGFTKLASSSAIPDSSNPVAAPSNPPRSTNSVASQLERVKSVKLAADTSPAPASRTDKIATKTSRDPWDAILIPAEPDPEDFDTFEAFEAAMRRWGHLVSQIEVVPMHASQLPSVIPLAVLSQQQQVKTSDQIVGKQLDKPRRAGLPLVDFWDPLQAPAWREEENRFASTVRTPFLPDLEVDDLPVELEGFSAPPTPRVPGALGGPYGLLDSPSTSFSEFQAMRASVGSASTSAETTPRFASICKDDVVADVHNGLAAIYNRAMQNRQKYPPYHNAPVLGELRGTFPKPNWATNRARLPLRSDALRRTDLTPLQIESSHVGPAMVDGRAVEFQLPEFDLHGVQYRDLVQDASYRQSTANRVLQFQFHTRHHPCYSWYRKTPQAKIAADSKVLKALVKSKTRNADLTELTDILLGSMDLDVFQDILGEDVELPNGETKTHGAVLAQSITLAQFPQLLDLFERTQEPLAHSKISSFVATVLQFSKAHELVQFLVGNGQKEPTSQANNASPQFAHLASSATDILTSPRLFIGTLRNKGSIVGLKYLPLLCYALSYFRPVKMDIYPYSPELVTLAANVIGTEYKPLMELIFVYYYVKTIQSILQAHVLEYGAAAQHVNRTLNVVSTSLLGQLMAYPAFLGSLISSIGFRSVTVSSLFTFLTLQLLHCDMIGTSNYTSSDGVSRLSSRPSLDSLGTPPSPNQSNQSNVSLQQSLETAAAIKSLLADSSVDLLGSLLKKLASSKFTHVRQACQRIVAVLSSPSWIDTSLALIEESMMRRDGPFADAMKPSKNISAHYLESLGVILTKGLKRAIDSADYLIANPGNANLMVHAPISSAVRVPSSQSPVAPSSVSFSLASTMSTASSGSGGSANSIPTVSPPVVPLKLPLLGNSSGSGKPSNGASGTATIPYSELVAHHAASISFLLSSRVLYSLLRICGTTISEVDFRTQFATNLLADLGRAYTRLRTFKLAPNFVSQERSPSSRRISVFTLQQPPALESEPLLCQMRDWTQFPEGEKVVRVGSHELHGIFQFLCSATGPDPRQTHASKTGMLVCLRHMLKSAILFEVAKSEQEMHQTLSSLCRSPPYSTNTEAWRCLYQMVKFHPNTIEYLVKNKFLNLYFEGLGSYGTSDKWVGIIMTQNALKYMAKLFSLNQDGNMLLKRTERTSSSGHLASAPQTALASPSSGSLAGGSSPVLQPQTPHSPSKSHHNPDAKALSQFIINTHVFIKFHVIYKKLAELDCGAAYAELISFYHALLTLPNCKKLLKATTKHESFREGIAAVTQLLPLISEMQKQDQLWSAARAIITKERIRAFKLREKDDSSLSSPRKKDKTKDKEKDKEGKDKDKKKKDKDKPKSGRGKSFGASAPASPSSSSSASGTPSSASPVLSSSGRVHTMSPAMSTGAQSFLPVPASATSTAISNPSSSSPNLTSDATDTDEL